MEIKKEYCGIKSVGKHGKKVLRKPILPSEIEGVDTFYVVVFKHSTFVCRQKKNYIHIFLVLRGKGFVRQGAKKYDANEMALFVPSYRENASVFSKEENVEMLEIRMKLFPDETDDLRSQPNQLPYYVTYSQAWKYKESIKSEKTINRMLLPENIVPRFCMGSVETSGPDEVGAHAHPMLEQLFFGLANNNCTVRANNAETLFEENVLLHIPLGSVHQVRVKEGNTLNYIWMDFFRSREEMEYIAKNHIRENNL